MMIDVTHKIYTWLDCDKCVYSFSDEEDFVRAFYTVGFSSSQMLEIESI